MMTPLEPLSAGVEKALAAEAARPLPPSQMLERLALRLDADFATSISTGTPSEPVATPNGATAAAGGLGAKALLLSAGLAVGGVTGAQLQARFGQPREVIVERRVEVPVEVRVEVPVQAPVVPTPPTTPSPATAPKPIVPPAPQATNVGIEKERLLIEQAAAALSRGQNMQALQACALHETQFPQAQLSEERESLAIRALAALGRHAEAQTRAADFRQHYPDSVLLEVVEQALHNDEQ